MGMDSLNKALKIPPSLKSFILVISYLPFLHRLIVGQGVRPLVHFTIYILIGSIANLSILIISSLVKSTGFLNRGPSKANE